MRDRAKQTSSYCNLDSQCSLRLCDLNVIPELNSRAFPINTESIEKGKVGKLEPVVFNHSLFQIRVIRVNPRLNSSSNRQLASRFPDL